MYHMVLILRNVLKLKYLFEFQKKVLGDKDYKFVLFWMNRNIRRKQPSDVIWAYKKFVDGLPEKDRKDCCLLMHCG